MSYVGENKFDKRSAKSEYSQAKLLSRSRGAFARFNSTMQTISNGNVDVSNDCTYTTHQTINHGLRFDDD